MIKSRRADSSMVKNIAFLVVAVLCVVLLIYGIVRFLSVGKGGPQSSQEFISEAALQTLAPSLGDFIKVLGVSQKSGSTRFDFPPSNAERIYFTINPNAGNICFCYIPSIEPQVVSSTHSGSFFNREYVIVRTAYCDSNPAHRVCEALGEAGLLDMAYEKGKSPGDGSGAIIKLDYLPLNANAPSVLGISYEGSSGRFSITINPSS